MRGATIQIQLPLSRYHTYCLLDVIRSCSKYQHQSRENMILAMIGVTGIGWVIALHFVCEHDVKECIDKDILRLVIPLLR